MRINPANITPETTFFTTKFNIFGAQWFYLSPIGGGICSEHILKRLYLQVFHGFVIYIYYNLNKTIFYWR